MARIIRILAAVIVATLLSSALTVTASSASIAAESPNATAAPVVLSAGPLGGFAVASRSLTPACVPPTCAGTGGEEPSNPGTGTGNPPPPGGCPIGQQCAPSGGGGGGDPETDTGDTVTQTSSGRAVTFWPDAAPNYHPEWTHTGQCRGNSPWGPYIGIETQYTVRRTYVRDGESYRLTGSTYLQPTGVVRCIDPPRYTETGITCVTRTGGQVVGPERNPEVTPVTVRKPVRTTRFGRQIARRDQVATGVCESSWFVQFQNLLEPFGLYTASVEAHGRECVLRTYTSDDERTGTRPANFIHACGAEGILSTGEARYQQHCDPNYISAGHGGNRAFTGDDCEAVRWDCDTPWPPRPRLGGRLADPVQVLADGDNRRLRWRRPNPGASANVRNVTNRRAQLQYRSGSPFREGERPGGALQFFEADPSVGSWFNGWSGKAGGRNTGWDLRFMKAGVPEQPWEARARWYFEAEFRSTYATGIRVDARTGAFTLTTADTWTPSWAICDASPTEIDVYRSRISTN